jgi:hypothetical protein
MAAAIDATVGGASANSYTTVAEFATWADERQPATAHTDATADERIRALISAARRLDVEQYKGVRTNGTQALQWPRYGVPNPDIAYSVLNGVVFSESANIASDVIPDRIKRAQMELAYQILAGNASPDDTGLEGFRNVKVGSLDITPNHARRAGVLPESVRREIRPLMLASDNAVRLVRG